MLSCPGTLSFGFWGYVGQFGHIFGYSGKEKLSLGQFSRIFTRMIFCLYEISLWLPEGKKIPIPDGSARVTRGRRGSSAKLCLTLAL